MAPSHSLREVPLFCGPWPSAATRSSLHGVCSMREISFSSSTADPFRTPQLLKLSRPSPWAKAAGPSSMLCRNGRATYVTMAEESKMKAVRKRIFALYQRKKEAETERRKRPQEISLPTPTTPKTLSTVMGLSTVDVLKALIKCGVRALLLLLLLLLLLPPGDFLAECVCSLPPPPPPARAPVGG